MAGVETIEACEAKLKRTVPELVRRLKQAGCPTNIFAFWSLINRIASAMKCSGLVLNRPNWATFIPTRMSTAAERRAISL